MINNNTTIKGSINNAITTTRVNELIETTTIDNMIKTDSNIKGSINNAITTKTISDLINNSDKTIIKTIGNLIYPVGSIYLSLNNDNPGDKFGGTWEKIEEGRFLMASGNSENKRAGNTGGSTKISVEQLPAHNHKLTLDYSNNTTSTFSGSTGSKIDFFEDGSKKDYITYDTTSTGGGQDYYPYYLAVSMWKRTA